MPISHWMKIVKLYEILNCGISNWKSRHGGFSLMESGEFSLTLSTLMFECSLHDVNKNDSLRLKSKSEVWTLSFPCIRFSYKNISWSYSTIVFFNPFYQPDRALIFGIKCVCKHKDLQNALSQINTKYMPMGRGSETQLQVSENLNTLTPLRSGIQVKKRLAVQTSGFRLNRHCLSREVWMNRDNALLQCLHGVTACKVTQRTQDVEPMLV